MNEDWLKKSVEESSRRARALPEWKRELVISKDASVSKETRTPKSDQQSPAPEPE